MPQYYLNKFERLWLERLAMALESLRNPLPEKTSIKPGKIVKANHMMNLEIDIWPKKKKIGRDYS